jgi:phosphohistidine phosphatase
VRSGLGLPGVCSASGLFGSPWTTKKTTRVIIPVMKRLFLLRHAKSSWDEPGLADRERPLAPRGRKASKLIARHMRDEGLAPELVLCSPSVRTRETLRRLGLGDEVEVRIDDDLYAASAGELLSVLNGLSDGIDSVMLIAHNPGIEDLTLQLAGGGEELGRVREKFPTAALATLELGGSWHELAPGTAKLVAFVRPKELRG